jgi:DNA-directed RNA polymerase subunit RPC12/RpoP
MNKNLVKGIIVGGVVLVAVLGWMLYSPANNANFPGGTDWLCMNPSCKTSFNLSVKQLAQYSHDHAGDPVKCPKCGTAAVRAEKCQHCGKVFPMQPTGPHICPYCGKPNVEPVTE